MNNCVKSLLVFGAGVCAFFCMVETSAFAQTSTNVVNWSAVPEGQEIAITHAVFDQGGYQLVETDGETIVVPFSSPNLYVMQFALSNNNATYFTNSGTAPVLSLPKDGYLDNASVPGTRWYPFTTAFQPADPVYEGIAPSWHDFILMGWYAGMNYYGGYSTQTPFADGATLTPASDLYALIDGQEYQGWSAYNDYATSHGGYNYVTYYNKGIYERASNQPPAVDNQAAPSDVPPTPVTAPPVVQAAVPAPEPGPVPVDATPAPAQPHVFRGAIGYGFYGQFRAVYLAPGEQVVRNSNGYYIVRD